ncbi:Carbonate dehydratase eukaryotic-type [Paragonimus heterotremus]|uniref:Carbonic anhydrase n=1 Tax=Paragonimus heterotremus TaxID=100268 RepID=A0A8J4SVF0_9TREM|nr:Carbonate dehydratase eukaryotic-type [Paragonimus heterotremus]
MNDFDGSHYIFISLQEWSYTNEHTKEAKWPVQYASCNGPYQSPVDIDSTKAQYSSTLQPVCLFPKNESTWSHHRYNVTNNGHSVKIDFPPDTWFVSFSNDSTPQYEAVQIHFHWGTDDSRGSEHSLHGMSFPLEAHLVCYNKLLYNSFAKAADSPYGLAVLGIWVNITSNRNTRRTLLRQLGGFQLALPNITDYNKSTTIKAFDLSRLLTLVDPKSYFRYEGSLTTPPCTSNVIWTVFRDSALITTQQLALFRNLHYPEEEKSRQMGDNFRSTHEFDSKNSLIPRVLYKTFV